MNSIVHELLKGFKPKLTQIFPTVGPRTDYVLKVAGPKVKVTDNIFKMHLSGGGIWIDEDNRRRPSSLQCFEKF